MAGVLIALRGPLTRHLVLLYKHPVTIAYAVSSIVCPGEALIGILFEKIKCLFIHLLIRVFAHETRVVVHGFICRHLYFNHATITSLYNTLCHFSRNVVLIAWKPGITIGV